MFRLHFVMNTNAHMVTADIQDWLVQYIFSLIISRASSRASITLSFVTGRQSSRLWVLQQPDNSSQDIHCCPTHCYSGRLPKKRKKKKNQQLQEPHPLQLCSLCSCQLPINLIMQHINSQCFKCQFPILLLRKREDEENRNAGGELNWTMRGNCILQRTEELTPSHIHKCRMY
jgi:hypothetical protein